MYASAHLHDVESRGIIRDTAFPVSIDADFEVAPGDAGDIAVVNAHPWGSACLVFSDGSYADSAQILASDPSGKGIS
jgi:hypothetical protein